jgi:hypothetical protein
MSEIFDCCIGAAGALQSAVQLSRLKLLREEMLSGNFGLPAIFSLFAHLVFALIIVKNDSNCCKDFCNIIDIF